MGEMRPSLAAEIEVLRGAYAALNRNDVPAMVGAFDPQIEWIEEFPGGGTYRGRAALAEHVTQARGLWAEGACEPQRFIVAGDKIVVCSQVRVRYKGRTDWIEGPVTDVCTFRNGKAIQMRSFADRAQALEWAGVDASEAE